MAGIPVILVFFLIVLLPVRQSVKAQITFTGSRSNFSFVNRFGNAAIIPDVGLRLTDQTGFVTGGAFYAQPVRMKNSESADEIVSFSTTFVFTVVPPPDISKTGDGLVFVMRPNASLKTPLFGLYLGLFDNSTSMGRPENHLFGIEFDLVQNKEFGDINNNHVGVDLNSLISVESKSAGYWVGNQFVDLDLRSGRNIQAWIDYDHLQNELKVTIAPVGSLRPEKPLMSVKNLQLSSIFEENMYVGFSAATGGTIEDNYILAWSFSTTGTAPALDTSNLPSLLHTKSKSKKVGLIAGVATAFVVVLLLAAAAATLVWFRRKKRTDDVIEEWEEEYWPHRFRYRDLHTATKGFGEEQVIGRGGFGKVYKGFLAANRLEVAVKCILRETSEGLKEFIAEISSLGRLQHRNLVLIRGYCRRGKKLFIVYDYMPNGSLDKMIFGNPESVLGWAQRYRILRDVAAGLLYLHEEWEQRVVHRDIKSSNILLDSELRGKVGDFGLARLYAHGENSQTTRVAGTPGYIAPEVAHTGKATPSTDVFSFGVLMLEVACGRRPSNPSPDGAQTILFDWVVLMHVHGKLMDAVDPKLGGEFDEDEMETVLKLGVICCNPQAEGRPDMRQVVQILEGGASLTGFELQLSGSDIQRSRFELLPEFENKASTPIEKESGSFSRPSDASCTVSLEAR